MHSPMWDLSHIQSLVCVTRLGCHMTREDKNVRCIMMFHQLATPTFLLPSSEAVNEGVFAVFYAVVIILRRRSGRALPLFTLATPPRLEISFWILLMPSAIFTTQAASPASSVAALVAVLCLVFAFLLFLWCTCWVLLWKIIVRKSIVFVVLPRPSRASFFGAHPKGQASFVTPGTRTASVHPVPVEGSEPPLSQVGPQRPSNMAGFVPVDVPPVQARWCDTCFPCALLVCYLRSHTHSLELST
jgi:hypothetical protein